ncbi:bifunctional glycosyltransferase/CDP-glycerol:glycerophosphate glycerophosphotransferase [Actinomadura flavalba]|uniref:bifunctional glycosyltransferase/CDP-glycerol:glycerophosphate glycerophosphotransferase n=1 Tax=Actinomadura flavalba TaxID=1120938 RepID=UPI00037FDBA6|nr:bifunctional glycosyltransferase/CDP-glycerol:glycerophosphate glycerophosphotransferase [Actinomadura flavalba]
MPAKLSVVVPMHNVQDYLAACLESLAAQTLDDLEVLLVDDGSQDDTVVIAESFAAGDPRFRVLRQDNLGPGPARNHGIAEATGEYLAFADGDDLLPPQAYALLVASLDRTGSDLACGNAHRFESDRTFQSWLHDKVFTTARERTHITQHPPLVRDRCVWNKVYRRSFWDAHGFTFPDGLYEDCPVAVGAHLAASAIDVIEETVYFWRRRAGSITAEKFDLDNYEQRVRMVTDLRARFARQAPALLPHADEQLFIDVDLRVLLEALPRTADEDRGGLLTFGAAVIRALDPAVVAAQPALLRLQMHLLSHGRLDELLDVLTFVRIGAAKDAPYVQRGRKGRWFAQYPFFEDAAAALPEHLYDVTDELAAVARVDRLSWNGPRLRIEGHAYVRGIDASSQDDLRLRLWLVAEGKKGLRRLPVKRVPRPDVTALSRQSTVSCEWSGFVTEVDPAELKVLGIRRETDWRLVVEVITHGRKWRRTVAPPREARQRWPLQRELPDGVLFHAVTPRFLRLRVRRPGALITAHRRDGDHLEIEGVLAREPAAGTKLIAASPVARTVRAPLTVTPDGAGRFRFTARLPLARLGAPEAVNVGVPAGLGAAWESPGGVGWSFRLSDGTKPVIDESAPDGRYAVPGHDGVEVVITRSKFANLTGSARPALPVLTSARWDGGRFTLTGTWSGGPGRPDHLLLRRHRSSKQYTVATEWDGDRFTAAFEPAAMPEFGAALPLARGTWNVRARAGDRELPVVAERAAMRNLPPRHVVGLHEFETHATGDDAVQLRVRVALADDESGGYAQRLLHTEEYARFRREPLLDLAVFDAFDGRQYSDNPRGVFEELRRTRPEMECVWVTRDGQFPAPDGARVVLSGSREHVRAMARAKVVFGNWRQATWFVKREGQQYVQLWHGTPLKKIGYDLKEMPYKRTEGVVWMDYDVPNWDLLVAQNSFSEPLFRSAFRYTGEIATLGYPRNDLLNRPERHRLALEVRERLGIAPGTKVVMYAPTWRDDFHFSIGTRGFQLALDLDAAAAALGGDHVLLLRTHYLVTDKPAPGENPFVIDVSDYPDIAELYLITDVFITDYSSSMFDFAVTGKPMLFYTYDLERYRDHVRGFYFDFEAESPGPLLSSSDEVIKSIADIDAVSEWYAGAYAAFRAKFCPHDDGRAGARVLERVLR